MTRPPLLLSVFLLAVLLGCDSQHSAGPAPSSPTSQPATSSLRIAVSVDAVPAFKALSTVFTQQTGIPVTIRGGRSPNLGNAIADGEPYDGFASAKPEDSDHVVRTGFCPRQPQLIYGIQRIAMWTRPDVEPPKTLDELADPRWRTIVMTQMSPYATHFFEATVRKQIWDKILPRLIYAPSQDETVRIAKESADVAVFAWSFALTLKGNTVPVSPRTHSIVEEHLLTCRGTHDRPTDGARRFVEFASAPESLALLKSFGFENPKD